MADRSGPDLLVVENVRYAYGDVVAVWDVSLVARPGTAVAIVGRNGAGKTTLLMGLAGLLPAAAGTVTLDGTNITNAKPWVRASHGLCLVPEGKRVFRELTVEENIVLAVPGSVGRRERGQRVEEVLDRFSVLGERRREHAASLSGGQQQLLAIASALACRPSVLLVDEPSSGLAPVMVDHILDVLQGLRDDGIAIVIVEQLVEEVVGGIADDVQVIDQGRVVLQGAPHELDIADIERYLYVS